MRLAVVADIHANVLALEAVIADMASREVDRVIDLGDCVAGPLWPRETLARLRTLLWDRVRGNHDRTVADGTPQTLSRFDAFAFEQLDDDGRRWLRDLPARLTLEDGIVAFHACPDDDSAYLTEDVVNGRLVTAAPAVIAGRLGGLDARIVLTGHSHLPLVMRLPDGRWIVNPGSVGMPAYRDGSAPAHVSESGSPAARYAIVDTGSGASGPRIELFAIPYDHAAASRRAASVGHTDLAYGMATGFMAPDEGTAARFEDRL